MLSKKYNFKYDLFLLNNIIIMFLNVILDLSAKITAHVAHKITAHVAQTTGHFQSLVEMARGSRVTLCIIHHVTTY